MTLSDRTPVRKRPHRFSPQRLGGSRLGVRIIGRVVSPLRRWLYRATKGKVSLTGRAPVLLLTTFGRRTGLPRSVPVFYVGEDDALVVCNVTPPGERINPWVLNLTARPECLVELAGRVSRRSAHPATPEEVDRYWPRLIEVWRPFLVFHEAGGRKSIFVLKEEAEQ